MKNNIINSFMQNQFNNPDKQDDKDDNEQCTSYANKFIIFQDSLNPIQFITKQEHCFYQLSQSGQWTITDQQFNENQISDLMTYIKTLKIRSFVLYANQQPSIISHISHPLYQNLIKLQLAQNNIVSIQSLQFMNAFKLQFLDLRSNRITSFQPFVKIRSFHLDQLRLTQNYYRSGQILQHLSRTYLSKQNQTLKRLQLQQNYNNTVVNLQESNGIVQDLSRLVKLNITNLLILKLSKKIRIKNITYHRIKQYKTIACLHNKNKQQIFLNDGNLRDINLMKIYY